MSFKGKNETMPKFFLSLLTAIFWACTAATPTVPPLCEGIDFSGDAFPTLTTDSLNAEMEFRLMKTLKAKYLEGSLRSKRGAITDSGQICVGTFSGRFHAPLGDDAFDSTGVLYLSGLLKQNGDRYSIIWNVEFGLEGFVPIKEGWLDFDWNAKDDDRIYYVGSFCFE
jgi:hypothetical protein